ncbi:ribonucleotide-diphosphate reductase subunit beta [Klebsiella michiganensis]|nr:ribonucleotide-diphosphate reductase subunit beta [Klebsiella michiganensis]
METWAFSETIHSRSYTHIIRNIVNDPAMVFDDIVTNEQIQKRAERHFQLLR